MYNINTLENDSQRSSTVEQSLRKGEVGSSNLPVGSSQDKKAEDNPTTNTTNMNNVYSRRAIVQERKNIRKAALYILLTILAIIIFIFFGIPLIAKTASFIGELRKSNGPIEKTDTTPPASPTIQSPPEYTNQPKIEIKGSTEPGISIIVNANSKKEEIISTKEGLFTYTFELNEGENKISFIAKDNAGNESQESKVYTIIYDNKPPKITIDSPKDGESFYGSKQRQIVIQGKVEDADTLKINDRIVIIENDGSFTYAVTLQEGDNNFEIVASDKAGNTTTERLTVQFWR